jgi:hypothetical protein
MTRHRLAQYLETSSCLPRFEAPAPAAAETAFVMVPATLALTCTAPWQQNLYQIAFQTAQAVVQPSIFERCEKALNWN